MIVGDGMADRPLKELNYRTPLEAAKSKSMSQLASIGVSGLLDPIAPGVVPESDVANLSLLGYDPSNVYTGRGPLEAVGACIQLQEGDVAFRCNFATVDGDLKVVDERAGKVYEGLDELTESLQALQLVPRYGIEFLFKRTLGFRGVLVLRGQNLSPSLFALTPKLGNKADMVKPMDDSIQAKETADGLRSFIRASHEILKGHPVNRKRKAEGKPPANIVIPWGGGRQPNLQPLCEKYKLKAACVAAVSLIKGICKLSGMTVMDVPEATGDIDTDTTAKARAALRALQDHDLIFLHVEGPDEASHSGNILGKISIIEKIDSMIGLILERVDPKQTWISLLADHTTSTRLRRHTSDPAPIVIAGANVIRDGLTEYCERSASRGGLGRIRGRDLMPMVLDFLGKGKLEVVESS